MPELGEVKKATEIMRKGNIKYIWAACVDCGERRWVHLQEGKPRHQRCHSCAIKKLHREHLPYGNPNGKQHGKWRGGRAKDTGGYVLIKLFPDDFFYPMASKKGYVFEHRLVVAKALARCLLPWEVVHHKGTKYPQGSRENRGDNRYPENLELLPTKKYHLVDTVTRSLIARLEKRVTLLEAENIILHKQLEESLRITA